MSASAESSSRSTARSPIDTMPTGFAPSTTGTRRMLCCRTSSIASSTESSGERVCKSVVATSLTVVDVGSLPSATTRSAMSRSVRKPLTLSPSPQRTPPKSLSRISLAASATVVSPATSSGFCVMTSRMLCAIGGFSPLVRKIRSIEAVPGVRSDKRLGNSLQKALFAGLGPGEVELVLDRLGLIRNLEPALQHRDSFVGPAREAKRAAEAVQRVGVVDVGLPGGPLRERLDRLRVELDRRVVVARLERVVALDVQALGLRRAARSARRGNSVDGRCLGRRLLGRRLLRLGRQRGRLFGVLLLLRLLAIAGERLWRGVVPTARSECDRNGRDRDGDQPRDRQPVDPPSRLHEVRR